MRERETAEIMKAFIYTKNLSQDLLNRQGIKAFLGTMGRSFPFQATCGGLCT